MVVGASIPSRGLLLPLLLVSSLPQTAGAWHDPSPHSVRFVTVEKQVRLEVLDWGGSGRPLVLLAGGGNTAHVFDDFAPQLTTVAHVYGLTRRGFGMSGFSSSENAVERLRDDLLAVLDALGLERPVLAGHSIAGGELSAAAASRPGRIAGLVYLEAAYPYALQKDGGPTMKQFFENSGPQAPTPAEPDRASFSALREWDARTFGFRTPESEFRQTWQATPDGRPANPSDFPGMKTVMAALTNARAYAVVPVPVLAVFASPHLPEPWVLRSPDPAVRKAARTYLSALNALTEAQARSLADAVPTPRVVRLRGAHYVFLSNEAEVLRQVRAFLSAVK